MMKLALQFESTHALKTHLLLCVYFGAKKFLAYVKVQDKRYRSLMRMRIWYGFLC